MTNVADLPFELQLQPGYPLPGRFVPLSQHRVSSVLHTTEDAPRFQMLKERLRRQQPARCDLAHSTYDLEARAQVTRWLQTEQRRKGLSGTTDSDPPRSLGAQLLSLQEDLVVMLRPAGSVPEAAHVAYIDVSFPSGWAPETVLGHDFARLHAPVPAHDRFGEPHRERLARLLFGRQVLLRFVWTVTPDDALDRHPLTPLTPLTPWTHTTRVFLRVERQVIVPLSDRLSVFVIRLYVLPCAALPEQLRADLRQAVRSMPDAVARYKGLFDHRSTIAQRI